MSNRYYGHRKPTNCRPKNPCILIRKVTDLMEHPISSFDTQRHLEMLNEFLNVSQHAFCLQDIPYIIRLYDVIVKNLDKTPEYQKPLECLLHFSAAPPVMTKSSDKLDYARDFQEYFTVLGYLTLVLHDANLKKLALNAIKSLITPKPQTTGCCCVSPEFCKEAIEKSDLPKILAQIMPVFSNELSQLLLDVIYLVCDISKKTCHKMIEEDMLDYIILRFYPGWQNRDGKTTLPTPSPDDKNPFFDDLCCILWKLLNAIDTKEVKEPSVFSLWNLQYAFRWSNICPGQKLNRNNIMALILKMLVIFPTTNFHECGLFEDIIIIAGAVAGCPCHSVLQFSDDEMDFQFKKIVWAALHSIRDFKCVQQKELMKAFLKYIFHEHPTSKNLGQYCTLIKILLKIVPKYLNCSVDTFVHLKGASNLMMQTEAYLSNTFNTELLEAYLYCIREMLMVGAGNVVEMFGERDTSNIIIAIVRKILEVETLARDYQKVLAHAFCILQILCAARFVTNTDVVDMVICFLNRVIQPRENDPLIDVRVTICAIHLLWECIARSKQFFREFLKQGGMYIMLDITEASTFPVKSLSLGVLADSARNSSCVPYLITWRKRGIRIMPMLMEIFRGKTETDCHSAKKIELPETKAESNHLLTLCHRRVLFQIKCISKAELLKRCRYRIHGLLYALKVKYRDKVNIANEHYRLFNEELNPDDALTTLFAENFVSLIMCDSWLNVSKELRKEHIVPIEEDDNNLEEKIHSIQQWKSYLQKAIAQIVEKEAQQQYFDEFTTYKTLKEARLSDALDALEDLRYISNSTEKMFQLRKKLRLQQEVDTEQDKNPNFHRTICDLPVTNTYNQTISIQSNVIYEKKEEYFYIAPVSSDSSESFGSVNSEHALTEPVLQC